MAQSHSGIGKKTHRGLKSHINGHGQDSSVLWRYYGLRYYEQSVQTSAQIGRKPAGLQL